MIADSNLLNWLCDNRSINLTLSSEEHVLLNQSLGVSNGDVIWLSRRRKIPEVCLYCFRCFQVICLHVDRAGPLLWVASEHEYLSWHMPAVCAVYYCSGEAFIPFVGDYVPHAIPHFLWITEFPLFTRADPDKEFLAHGRWSSTHHPFTAPMWQDIEAMYAGHIDQVRANSFSQESVAPAVAYPWSRLYFSGSGTALRPSSEWCRDWWWLG